MIVDAPGDSRRRRVTKRQLLDDHLVPFFGQMALSAIGPAQIEDFKAHMRKKKSAARARNEAPTKAALRKRGDVEPKPLSLKTINNVLSALSKLLALAEEQRVIPQAPRVRLFGKLPKPTFDFLTFEEAERLIDAAEPEWRTLLLVALKMGLRQGELIGLPWSDLDLSQGRLNVRRTIWSEVIQELMGHVTIEMTERYAHLSPDTRREAVSVLDRPLPLAPACDIRATRMEEAANHP